LVFQFSLSCNEYVLKHFTFYLLSYEKTDLYCCTAAGLVVTCLGCGKGRVVVALERNGRKIAVEVCHTTDADWEMHNIQKCLNAGYELVVEYSDDKKTLEGIAKKLASTFDLLTRTKILVVEPDTLFAYLDMELAKEASTEKRVKVYRV